MIGLPPPQRRLVRRLLDRHLPGRAVQVFGSRATGRGLKPWSDLDLWIGGGGVDPMHLADLREAFEQSDLPFRVDLVVAAEVGEAFQRAIEADLVALPHETGAD